MSTVLNLLQSRLKEEQKKQMSPAEVIVCFQEECYLLL